MIQKSRNRAPVPSSSNYGGPLQPHLSAAIKKHKNLTQENYVYDGETWLYPLTQSLSKTYSPRFIVNEN